MDDTGSGLLANLGFPDGTWHYGTSLAAAEVVRYVREVYISGPGSVPVAPPGSQDP